MLIEGQSSLRNPSGPCGSELLLSADVDGVVLVHPFDREYFDNFEDLQCEIPSLEDEINLIKSYGKTVLGVCINSKQNILKNILKKYIDGPICILIGPEGDFSENERKMIIDLNQTHSISLAKNILKAETAALSAITIVNYHLNLS